MKLLEVNTPAYVIDKAKLEQNLQLLAKVQEATGAKILLAQKAFSAYSQYPLIGRYLAGTTASGLFEARLGYEEMHKENHVFAPAYHKEEIPELAAICDHMILNSVSQIKLHAQNAIDAANSAGNKDFSLGLRINPECSTQGDHAIYDPCAPGSRLGVTISNLEESLKAEPKLLDCIKGLHFHTLCEQNSDDLEITLKAVEDKFGKYLHQMEWINMGGGHHITRSDYDVDRLIRLINHVRDTYQVKVYLEPGEAVALNAGYLITEVMDVVNNGISTLILDASAACHMPDVLEMPYRPPLEGGEEAGVLPFTYRLSSCTCLAGDIIGDYSFDHEIKPGDRLVFKDMAIYSMVKNNTFNGICLPSIYEMEAEGDCRLIRAFGYDDFKMRL